MEQFDRKDVERLVNTYSDTILRLSYTYLKSTQDAEDICQTVFLKLLTNEKAFENSTHEKAWIIRTTVNACKDELRAYRRRSVPLDNVLDIAAPMVPSSDVLDAVMKLPPKYREAIYLYYYEGYSVKEISSLLKCNKATVSARLCRGRNKLRIALGGIHDESAM